MGEVLFLCARGGSLESFLEVQDSLHRSIGIQVLNFVCSILAEKGV